MVTTPSAPVTVTWPLKVAGRAVGECEVTVTLCFGFHGMTPAGHPILRDRLNNTMFVLMPYHEKEEKNAEG